MTMAEINEALLPPPGWQPVYTKWRHGGWYVVNVRYPSGSCGCVSKNYADGKWRVVCGDHDKTYESRDDAARAEYAVAKAQELEAVAAAKAFREDEGQPWGRVQHDDNGELAIYSPKFKVKLASFVEGMALGFKPGDELYRGSGDRG